MIDQPIVAANMLTEYSLEWKFLVRCHSQPYNPTLDLLEIFDPHIQSINAQ